MAKKFDDSRLHTIDISSAFKMASAVTLAWVLLLTTLVKMTATKSDVSCSNDQPDCVCSIPDVIRRLKDYMELYEGGSLENKIKDFECRRLERLPSSLKIEVAGSSLIFGSEESRLSQASGDGSGNPAGLFERFKFRRKRRYVNLGVPTNEVFNDAIAHLDPEALHQYVILGSSVTFHCGEAGEGEDVGNTGRAAVWTHYNGDPITAPQAKIDRTRGSLTIPTVQLSDIGIYNCSQEISDAEYGPQVKVTSHQLSVISEPIFWLKLSANYEAVECNQEEAHLIRKHVPDWIKAHVCPLCEVHNASVTCFRESPDRSNYRVGSVVSAIGLSIKMEKTTNVESCRISCLEMAHARILELVRDGMIKAFKVPIVVEGSGGQKLVHKALRESFKIDLLQGCLSGFHLKYKLCFPCRSGHFSREGENDCLPCPIGHFQPQLASTSCFLCPHGSTTTEIGSTSASECYGENLVNTAATISAFYVNYKIFLGVTGGLILLFVVILLSICLCCPKSGTGRVVRKYCCCCCVRTTGRDYEKLEEESDEAQSRKSKRKDKERRKSRGSQSKVESSMRSASRSTRRESSKKTRPASKLRQTRNLLQLDEENENGEGGYGFNNGFMAGGNESVPSKFTQDNPRPAVEAEGTERSDTRDAEESSRSASDGEESRMSPGDDEDGDVLDAGNEGRERLTSNTTNSSARLEGSSFNSVFDELQFRFSLQKPIGASSESSDSPDDPGSENNLRDLQRKSSKDPIQLVPLSSSSSEGSEDEDCDIMTEGYCSQPPGDTPGNAQRCFKPTPLRELIALHNERIQGRERSSVDSVSDAAASPSASSPEEESEEEEELPSFDRGRIPPPPPMPPPPPVWRPSGHVKRLSVE